MFEIWQGSYWNVRKIIDESVIFQVKVMDSK